MDAVGKMTASENMVLKRTGEEFWIFRQITRENWANKMPLNFAVSAKLFTGGFLNFLPHFHFVSYIVVCHTVHLLRLWHFLKLEDQIHSGVVASNGSDSRFQKCKIWQPEKRD